MYKNGIYDNGLSFYYLNPYNSPYEEILYKMLKLQNKKINFFGGLVEVVKYERDGTRI